MQVTQGDVEPAPHLMLHIRAFEMTYLQTTVKEMSSGLPQPEGQGLGARVGIFAFHCG